MTAKELFNKIKEKRSFLCVGLDTDINRLPSHLLSFDDPVFEFNKRIIDATSDICVAYKPNIAFYESMGLKGWESLEKTIQYIPDDIFTIADAKRGDIGNTSKMYAQAFFEKMNFDSITLAPYMGSDSIKPFLEYKDKWSIILAVTSNLGGLDFQMYHDENKNELYKKVISLSKEWGDNIMYVVGATRAEIMKEVRSLAPENFLLVPGIGAQGGDLDEVVKHGMNDQCGLLVNSSRGIIYASSNESFAEEARKQALVLQHKMEECLKSHALI